MYNELYHHGVKGQKWGVRRYQNKDGSLTEKGRKKYLKQSKEINSLDRTKKTKEFIESKNKRSEENVKNAGVKLNDSNGTDLLKKNSEIYRIANSDEPITSKRKYVSITIDDKSTYDEMFDLIGIDMHKPISEYTYSAKKDLKIASGKNVVDHILKTYGDEKVSQYIKDLKDNGDLSELIPLSKKNKRKYQLSITYSKNAVDNVNKFFRDTLKSNINEIVDYYKEKKYDAIVDAEDYISKVADYPLILLDPKNSIKLKNEKKWNY